MNLTNLFNCLPRVLEKVKTLDRSRQYSYNISAGTIGLCAEMGTSIDFHTIGNVITSLMPVSYPPDIAESMAILILFDQACRYLPSVILAVDEATVFAPSIAYAALNGRAPVISNVRYFDSWGADKDPQTMPKFKGEIDALIIAGRSSSIERYMKYATWPSKGIAVVVNDGPIDVFQDVDIKKQIEIRIDSTSCSVSYWGD